MPESDSASNDNEETPSPEPCGLGRRILVMLYDALALIAIMIAVTALSLLTPLRDQVAFRDPFPTAVLFVTWYLYLGWCWRRGLTLGMRAWRVRLIFEGDAGWGRYALRFVVSLVSAACAGLGFAWSLFEPKRRTWHDMASNSRLVRTPK